MEKIIYANGTAEVLVPAGQKIAIATYGNEYATLSFKRGNNLEFIQRLDNAQVTLGPWGDARTVSIEAAQDQVLYDVATNPSIESDVRVQSNPLTGVMGLLANGKVNPMFQPSSLYKFFIPGQQFIGSGNAAKDKGGNSADATFLASLTEANAWANPGYFTSGAGVNLGFTIPAAKVQFDLATQSVIFSLRLKKAATVGAESFVGCGDASTIQGFYLSMRAASGGVSKVRPVLCTSGGVVTGLADSTATFGEASATDHVLTLAIDGVTKSVFLYCDGTLSNTYPSAFTGGTTLSVPFGFGFNTGTSGVTTVACQFSGAHMLVMNGGLPLNMGIIAQKLAATPHLYLTDSDLVF